MPGSVPGAVPGTLHILLFPPQSATMFLVCHFLKMVCDYFRLVFFETCIEKNGLLVHVTVLLAGLTSVSKFCRQICSQQILLAGF